MIAVGKRPAQDHFSKVSIYNFSGLKKYKKGYIEMTKKPYLETFEKCPGSVYFPLLCVHTHLLCLSLFIYLAVFLSCGVLHYLQKFELIFIQVRCVRQKRLFFFNEISVCHYEPSFSYFKLFSRTKVSQNAFNFFQRYTELV